MGTGIGCRFNLHMVEDMGMWMENSLALFSVLNYLKQRWRYNSCKVTMGISQLHRIGDRDGMVTYNPCWTGDGKSLIRKIEDWSGDEDEF